MKKVRSIVIVVASLWVASGAFAQDSIGVTTASAGLDYSEGNFGTTSKTTTWSIPVSIKHESGSWSLRASLPFVQTNGTFSRDQGVTDCRRSGTECTTTTLTTTRKRNESGVGDLTLGAFFTALELKTGFSVDIGAKAKLATADKAKTLITSGENDYSLQTDLLQSAGAASFFGSLGMTRKGDTAAINYSDPIYGSLGASTKIGASGSLGASWDFRQKTTSSGDPVSEITAFFSVKNGPKSKMQIYVVTGLADGSPDRGGGIVLSQRY